MADAPKPREVWLPVCPRCNRVGKVPMINGSRAYTAMCTGPPAASHAKRRMELRRFVEVRD